MLPDLICFSHLHWDFVWQRPQHLMMRATQTRRVWLVEEPETTDEASYWTFARSSRRCPWSCQC